MKKHSGNRKLVTYSLADFRQERAMIYAIVERAILDAAGITAGGTKADIGRAKAWLYEKSDEYRYPEWSFRWCCEHLGCSYKDTQRRIKAFIKDADKVRWARNNNYFTICKMLLEECSASNDYEITYNIKGVPDNEETEE